MTDRLVADYGVISNTADHFLTAAHLLSGSLLLPGFSGFGSAAVEGALNQTTAIHQARAHAVTDLLHVQNAGVRQAVLDLIAADHAAADQVAR